MERLWHSSVCALVCIVWLSVSGPLAAQGQDLCPYDASGNYTYDPDRTPTYLFYGDDRITYDGTIPWYMDDTLACYNVYQTPGYLQYFPKCDLDASGVVEITEVYDVYYRIHPVAQDDAIAQKACVEAFADGGFFFCYPSRYNRTVIDIAAILAQYPVTGAILDTTSGGAGHLEAPASLTELHCTTPGIFPGGVFDPMNACYLGTPSCTGSCPTVDISFGAAIDTSLAAAEYTAVAQQYGGICSPSDVSSPAGSAPGFHYYKHGDQGWWYWTVRTTADCTGGACQCDMTYELWTKDDQPGTVWIATESNDSAPGCNYPGFPSVADTTATLRWDPNEEDDLLGYKVYWGTAPRDYNNELDVGLTADPLAPSHFFTNLQPGETYFFAVTAYDAGGLESDYSLEVWKTLP